MLAETIGDLLFGRVIFAAEGGFPTLFLEECAAGQIPLRRVKKENETVCAEVDEKGFRQVNAAAKKAGMSVRVTSRRGLPFLLLRYRRRIGIPVGAVQAAALLFMISCRLLEVTLTGNDTISDDEILEGLRTLCVMDREAGVERNKQPDYFKRTVAVVESRLFGKDGDAGFAEQADAQAPDVSTKENATPQEPSGNADAGTSGKPE